MAGAYPPSFDNCSCKHMRVWHGKVTGKCMICECTEFHDASNVVDLTSILSDLRMKVAVLFVSKDGKSLCSVRYSQLLDKSDEEAKRIYGTSHMQQILENQLLRKKYGAVRCWE